MAEANPGPGGLLAADPADAWSPFGVRAPSDEGAATAASLGFVVAARSLLLTGGDRSVTVAIRSSSEFRQTVLNPLLERIASATGLGADAVLDGILKQAFSLSITTEKGWQEIATFQVGVVPDAKDKLCIAFHFELPPTQPAITALDPARARAPSDPAPDPRWPALLARLRQDPITLAGDAGTVSVHPLSLLEDLPVESVVIETRVKNLAGLRVTTSAGIADTTAAFAPFGSPARADAWFDIRHPELFTKAIDRLGITVHWLALPSHPAGFAGHYEQYVIGADREPMPRLIDNRSFKAKINVRGDIPWALSADGGNASVYLFRTTAGGDEPDASGALAPQTRLEFKDLAGSEAGAREPLAAAIRLTLSEPAFGFGDELYAPNVLNAVQRVPPRKCRFRWFCKLLALIGWSRPSLDVPPPPDLAHAYPNPPWQPQIAGISIDYDATDRLDDGAGTALFMHLLPTGSLAAAASDSSKPLVLLPTSGGLTHLDLGFGGLKDAQSLTLLFRMANDSSAANDACRVAWRYRAGERWVDLSPDALRRDGTNALASSGIVAIDVPPLPEAAAVETLSWLRVVPRSEPDGFPAILAVTANALAATRVADPAADPPLPVPANTVKAALSTLRGIATVDQPLASFGGEVAESDAMLPIRLGERLRHKERASLPWDYERLVLERFPEIAKVRALAGDAVRDRKAGEVVVAVVPGSVDAAAKLMPRAGIDLRARIQASLQGSASPFARVLVVDPNYIRIAARVNVLFRTVKGNAAIRLNDDLCDFLSPCSDGLDLPDEAGPAEIRTTIGSYIESRPYVASLISLELSFTPDLRGVDWCVPTSAAEHEIVAAAEAESGICRDAAADETIYV